MQRRCYLQKEKRSTAENLLVTTTFLKLASQPQENYFSHLLSEKIAFSPWVCRKEAFGKEHVLERGADLRWRWEWTARITAAALARALVAQQTLPAVISCQPHLSKYGNKKCVGIQLQWEATGDRGSPHILFASIVLLIMQGCHSHQDPGSNPKLY